MEELMNFPWYETFLVNTFLLGGLSGLILLLSKSPAGRWLGVVLLSCLLPILLKAIGLPYYLPSALVLILVSSFLYFRAFFYQRSRAPFWHFLILAFIWILNFFFYTRLAVVWTGVGIVGVSYLYFISELLIKESNSRGFSYFSNAGSRIAWLRNFVILEAVFMVLMLPPVDLYLNGCSFLFLLGHVVYQLFRESSFLSPIPIGNKYQKSTLTPEIKASIIDRLEEVMEEQHFYRNDDASLTKLASLLGVTTHHLSQVLNESMKISFQDLLARFRVREACLLLRDETNAQLKIETVANKVGYNSKSSFNTAFKKRTGLTPSEYRVAKNVRTYGEERLSERKAPSTEGMQFSLNHVFYPKMNKSMIRITLRNLRKHKLHTSLNVIGLSVGLAACLTIAAYVHYELSYDTHHPNANNLYRIALNRIYPDYEKKWAITAPILAPTITDQVPEIQHYTRFSWDDFMLSRTGERLEKQRISGIDSGFFELFQHEVISGEVTHDFFKRQDGIILTKRAAEKYFGIEDPVGQLLKVQRPSEEKTSVLKVEAVISNALLTTHLDYEMLCTMDFMPFPKWLFQEWGTWAVYSYIKIHPDADSEEVSQKINDIAKENMAKDNEDFESWVSSGNSYDYFLQPIADIHLTSNLTEEFEANSSEAFVYFFALVGVFILLMAVVNFVNLATARASYRTKEVGIRKTVGAGRCDLMFQFLLESTFICLIALLIAIPLTQLFLPSFNQTLGKAISLQVFSTTTAIAFLVATPFVLGLLSGFYPALYLSHFSPASVFQKLIVKRGKESLRHLLVVGQLVIAVILIACTVTVFRQMYFISHKPLGFDKDQLIKVDKLPFIGEKLNVFKQEAINIPGVKGVSLSNFPLDEIRSGSTISKTKGDEGWVNTNLLAVDESYIPTLGLRVIAGRNFLPGEIGTKHEGLDKIILNRAAVEAIGWQPEEAVNQKVYEASGFDGFVIGVVEDFNYSTLHRPVVPLQLSGAEFETAFRSGTIKLDPRRMREAIDGLEQLWGVMAPDKVFEFDYMDESMAQFYEAERLTGKLFTIFSGLGIFICCLGLFGLMGYVVEQRAKEVGIRKVMGARIRQIILLLSKDYIRLVLIASVIAIPVAWWGMSQWLDGFAYRVENSVWIFLSAGFLVAVISWCTVAIYSYHAAKANPVDSLRNE